MQAEPWKKRNKSSTFQLNRGKNRNKAEKRKEYKKQGEKRTEKVGEIEQISTSQLNTNYTSNYNKCEQMKLAGWKTRLSDRFFKKQKQFITRAKEGWNQNDEKMMHKH